MQAGGDRQEGRFGHEDAHQGSQSDGSDCAKRVAGNGSATANFVGYHWPRDSRGPNPVIDVMRSILCPARWSISAPSLRDSSGRPVRPSGRQRLKDMSQRNAVGLEGGTVVLFGV